MSQDNLSAVIDLEQDLALLLFMKYTGALNGSPQERAAAQAKIREVCKLWVGQDTWRHYFVPLIAGVTMKYPPNLWEGKMIERVEEGVSEKLERRVSVWAPSSLSSASTDHLAAAATTALQPSHCSIQVRARSGGAKVDAFLATTPTGPTSSTQKVLLPESPFDAQKTLGSHIEIDYSTLTPPSSPPPALK